MDAEQCCKLQQHAVSQMLRGNCQNAINIDAAHPKDCACSDCVSRPRISIWQSHCQDAKSTNIDTVSSSQCLLTQPGAAHPLDCACSDCVSRPRASTLPVPRADSSVASVLKPACGGPDRMQHIFDIKHCMKLLQPMNTVVRKPGMDWPTCAAQPLIRHEPAPCQCHMLTARWTLS
jgi:hypothetical protein